MKKILTVTVPAYNAGSYLENNLRSFCIPEIMDDIEILVINDGSADNTREIAEKYAAEYPDTYRLINKENGGHGSGINTGVRNAAGKYFKVVDADDWVTEDGIKALVKMLKACDSDVVASGFLWTYDNGTAKTDSFRTKAEIREPFKGVVYDREYFFDDIADRLYLKMHNFTIRTEIFRANHIRIDEHCYYVDTEYVLYPVPYIRTVRFLKKFVYMYRLGIGNQSISIEKMRRNEKNYDTVLFSLYSFYSGLTDQNCSAEKKNYIAHLIARVVAGKIKTLLSYPASEEIRQKLIDSEKKLQAQYPDIYKANINQAVRLMRMTSYGTYGILSRVVRKKYS